MKDRRDSPSLRAALVVASMLTLVTACGGDAGSTGALGKGGAGGKASSGTGGAGGLPTTPVDAKAGAGGGPTPTGAGGAQSSGGAGGGPVSVGSGGGQPPVGSGGAQMSGGASGGPAPTGGAGGGLAIPGSGGAPSKPTRLEDWSLAPDGTAPLSMGAWKWDTREKVHCHFVVAEDDKLRCLPDAPKHLVQYVDGLTTDPKCKGDPMWAVQQDGNVPIRRPWAHPFDSAPTAACAPAHYQVLRPLPEGTALYLDDGTGCKRYKPNAEEIPFVPLAVDPPENWELGTVGVGQKVSDRLHVADITTADGAHFPDHLVDDRIGQSCTLGPRKMGDGLECPTPAPQLQSFYSDPMCMSTVDVATVGACQPMPAYLQDISGNRFAVGAPFAGSVYRLTKAPCELFEMIGDGTAVGPGFLKGSPLPADAIASATEATTGTGRFRLRGLAGPNGAVVPLRMDLYSYFTLPFFDSAANEDCEPAWTPDGKVHCVSKSIAIIDVRYFSDGACKKLIYNCGQDPSCLTRKTAFGRADAYGRIQLTDGFTGGTRLEKTNIYYRDSANSDLCRQIGANVADQYEATGTLSWDELPTLPERNPLPAGL